MGAFKDLSGKEINGIKIVGLSGKRGNFGQYYYNCICHCGKHFEAVGNAIINGHTRSCGCSQYKGRPGIKGPHEPRNLIGRKCGELTVVSYAGYNPEREQHMWNCVCNCGRYVVVPSREIHREHKKSCGECGYNTRAAFLRRKFKTVEEYKLRHILNAMKMRCYNPKNPEYYRYGGRGIKVCDEWMEDTRVFVDWALAHGYRVGLTIERIDNNLGYSPSNCTWADRFAQMNNFSKNFHIKINDKLTLTRAQCARIIDIGYDKARTLTNEEIAERVKHCIAVNDACLVRAKGSINLRDHNV